GAGELDLVVEPPRLEHVLVETFQELPLRRAVHIKAVDDRVAREIVHQPAFQLRVVVPVVQRSGTGEEIEVAFTVLVGHVAALRGGEHRGPSAAVAADFRFQAGENVHVCLQAGWVGERTKLCGGSYAADQFASVIGPMRKSTSGSCSPSGKCSAPNSGLRTSSHPW